MNKDFEDKLLTLGSVETRKYYYRSYRLSDEDGFFHRITRIEKAKLDGTRTPAKCEETVKDIRVQDDLPVQFAWGDIANALIDNTAFEGGSYYLHMTYDQVIVPDIYSADITFTAKRDMSDLDEDDDIQDIFDTEYVDNGFFSECVDSLYDQAVKFFADLDT